MELQKAPLEPFRVQKGNPQPPAHGPHDELRDGEDRWPPQGLGAAAGGGGVGEGEEDEVETTKPLKGREAQLGGGVFLAPLGCTSFAM